ncbi:DNA-binding domain of Mlu1-box binding protein MBP1, partial [Suhomyces tanzawaensis NRRL Y-17324]
PHHHVTPGGYLTLAIDPVRNYLTVYEYLVNNHWIIWDYETGFVHLTGIWKASSSLKADIVKLLESTPKQYQPYIKRIRGGFLKIQGTWLPFNLCRVLARRFCYYIRYELIPIFG